MATVENFPGRLPAANSSERAYRSPPLNIEAEQALLGAILVNNDAFDRVSDFLKPEHFVEEIHRRIYEIAGSLIRAGKVATPITLKTFLGEHDLGGVTVQQYLARLAAEATTIINAFDYGRTIHDLAVRRELIQIGEDVVNVAYDAPVDSSPRDQIEEAERRLYAVAEGGRYDGGFQRFSDALKVAVDMAAKAYERDGSLSGVATGLTDLDRYMGGLQASDLVILAGRPGMGKTALATNIAFNIAKAYRGETQPDGTTAAVDGGRVGFFSLEMSAEQLATRIIAEQSGVPSYKIRRGDITENDFQQVAEAVREMQSIPFYIDQTGGISIAQLTARARRLKRQRGLDLHRRRLSATARRLAHRAQRQPRAGADRDHHRPQGAGQGAERADPGAVPAFAPGRAARRQAPAALGPARIRLDRAGRRRRAVRLSRGILPQEQGAAAGHRRARRLDERDGARPRPRRSSSSASSAMGPTGMVELQFEAELTRFGNLARDDALPEIR